MGYDGKATDKRRIQDTDGDNLEVTNEGLLPNQDSIDYLVETGKRNYVEYGSTVLVASSNAFVIETADDEIKIEFSVMADEAILIRLYEDSTYTGGGHGTPLNLKRSDTADVGSPQVKTYTGATILLNGTLLQTLRMPSGGKISTVDTRTVWQLKADTIYHIKLTNLSGSNNPTVLGITFRRIPS